MSVYTHTHTHTHIYTSTNMHSYTFLIMYVYTHVHVWSIYILSHNGVGNDQQWKNTNSNKLYFLSIEI